MKTKLVNFFCFCALLLPLGLEAQFNYSTNNNAITILQYTGSGGNVVVPDTINGYKVQVIGADAFYQNSGLTSVTFGTNVTTIGTNAIFQCPNLTSVTFAGSVTNIGTGPFIDCLSLGSIVMSSTNSIYVVTNNVLYNKPQTSLIEFPGGVGGSYTISSIVTNVGAAFIGNSLTSISVVSSNLYLYSTNGVLFNKNQSVLIEYPGALAGVYAVPTNKVTTTIQSAAFEYSSALSGVIIGTNITSIGLFALYDCPQLASITVNTNNATYSSLNGVLFDKKQLTLIQYPIAVSGDYVIPGTVKNVGDGAFGDAFGLTTVVVPNSVTNIGQETFYSCTSLGAISLGNGLATIGANAFFYCDSLEQITFPPSLTSIGIYAFGGCENLSSVCFEGNQPTDGGSIFYYDQLLTSILYVSGTTGWGATYDGIATAPCASCGGSAPILSISCYAKQVVLSWSTDFSNYTLQSTASLASPAWSTVSPAPVISNGNYVVTNTISGSDLFYRLVQAN